MKDKNSPINAIWFAIILISIVSAAWLGRMSELTLALFEESKAAVMLAVGLRLLCHLSEYTILM